MTNASAVAIKVQVVDDHPLWRQTLRRLLERDDFAVVVAEASDGSEAVALSQTVDPDVVVMDIVLPHKDGIEATKELTRARPETKVLVLASSEDRDQVLEAIQAGASGYLLKTAEAEEVREAVRRVHVGELVFPAPLSDVVLEELRHRERAPDEAPARASTGNAFQREGDYWTVVYEGDLIRLKDTKGARLLSYLLHHPGQEFHVLQLSAEGASERGAGERRTPEEGLAVSPMGGAGEVLDPIAKRSYKRRLSEIQQELDEAEDWNDMEREARLREEMDVLTRELAAAVGLGGRDREAASISERARVNATLAIRRALSKIAEYHPSLGEHLDTTIRTGTFCSYNPDPRAPTDWDEATPDTR